MAAWTNTPATISAGQTLSNPIDTTTKGIIEGLIVPSNWRDAALSFQFSIDNSTWYNVFSNVGAELIIPTVTAGSVITVIGSQLMHNGYVRIRSGSFMFPVVQPADAVFGVLAYG